ncbi:hypothetical protein ACOME3_005543 [Neoechinorhynchus agilis]
MKSFLLISLIAALAFCTLSAAAAARKDAKWVSEDDLDKSLVEFAVKSGKVPMKVERGKRFFFGPGIFLIYILFLLPFLIGGCGGFGGPGLCGSPPCGPPQCCPTF